MDQGGVPRAGDQSREEARAEARLTAARLSGEGVVALALTWVDNAGIARVKGVPLRRLAEAAVEGVGMSPVFDVFLVDDTITTSRYLGGPDGDLRLFPALDRAVPLAAQPGWAFAPADRYRQDGLPHPACQRRFAARMVERAAERGLSFRAAFETEWIVRRADEDGLPTDGLPTDGPAYGLHRVTDCSDYLRDLLLALEAQGLTVQQIHPEYSAGQFEVSVAARDALGAADDAVLVRATIRGVSARHGLRASFAPAFEPGGVGNGGHLHLSAWREDRNLLAGQALTRDGEAFLAGVLRELPALLALGAPSPASYLRLVPSHWAGCFQCWGVENREAALRLVQGPDEQANVEVKCFDQAANPYLAVGGVIAAGLAGLDAEAVLPEPVQGDPALLPPERQPARLPTGLDETLTAFRASTVLRDALGDVLFEAVAAVRAAENAAYGGQPSGAVIAATRWRY
ncbi:glutamine synthetase family protein [Streptacidiphilus jiangxiensis]|uniref:Glutamine synthetase n=1 Tax=Streptacidiphilus jiangxiensis TaxID=235985 RepID=A0A1H7LB43_STRJI|nr:glutamine synthetase family protein [Streptacidiphilus jiangxiensis]SEK96141.1 glutamine synthetase [Streptacidiphilus jiangxiensis]